MKERRVLIDFRDNSFRTVQEKYQSFTPRIIRNLYNGGWLDGTPVAAAYQLGKIPSPNDVTLAGLQLIIHSSDKFVHEPGFNTMGEFLVGEMLDVIDGPYAHHLNQASDNGAVNDAGADRVADVYLANQIAEAKHNQGKDTSDITELKKVFQFSTLTKASSQMLGVKTSETGLGSMVERRKKMHLILPKLKILNGKTNPNNPMVRWTLSEVNKDTSYLIQTSRHRAKERIQKILEDPKFKQRGWENPDLENPESGAAKEARKYAAIVRLNMKMGIDSVSHLNELAGQNLFPIWQNVRNRYAYVDECLAQTEQFLENALSLAHFN